MATAVINGIAVSGSVEEIYELIQKASTSITTVTGTDEGIRKATYSLGSGL